MKRPSLLFLFVAILASFGVNTALFFVFVPSANASHITWEPLGGPAGGFSRYLAQDSSNYEIIYAATDYGQIWKSIDGGKSWIRKSNGIPPVTKVSLGDIVRNGIKAVAISKKDPQVLFSGSNGGKIFKTTNGGELWQQVYALDSEQTIGIIRVSPHDTNLVIAGTYDGFLLISRDGGKSWQKTHLPEVNGTISGDIAFAPQNPDIIYIATSFFDVEPEGGATGLLKSEDKGNTWKKVGKGLESDVVSTISINPQNPNHLLAAIGTSFEWEDQVHGIWESFNGGLSFSKLSPRFDAFDRAWPFVAFSPDGSRIVVAGPAGGSQSILISKNGGSSWDSKAGVLGDFITDVVQFPNDPNRFVVTLYWSGVFYTEDGGITWQEAAAFSESTLHTVHAPNFDANRLYASAHSNGLFFSDNKGKSWKRIPVTEDSDINETSIHNFENSTSRVSPELVWLRSEYLPEIYILKNPENPSWKRIPIPNEITAVLAHPTLPSKALIGSVNGLFMADSKTLLLVPIPDFAGIGITAITGNEEIIVLGSSNGVWVSRDDGTTWKQAGLKGKKVIAVGFAEEVIYAAANDGVYKFSHEDFVKINAIQNVTQIVPDPGDFQSIYLATSVPERGGDIYYSDNGGQTFEKEEAGLIIPATSDPHKISFSADGTMLYLATPGLGVWKANIRSQPIPYKKADVKKDAPSVVSNEKTEKSEKPMAAEEYTPSIDDKKPTKGFIPVIIETIIMFFRNLFSR